MAKHSNIVNHNSPDGLPANPFPERAIPTTCVNCYNKITENPCPHCGSDNDIEYGPDYTADEKEYDKYDDL